MGEASRTGLAACQCGLGRIRQDGENLAESGVNRNLCEAATLMAARTRRHLL